MYGSRKAGFAKMLSAHFLNDYVRGNQFRKVVLNQSGKDLLVCMLHLFCVKMKQTNRIFQLAERSSNAPAHMIKLFQLLGWDYCAATAAFPSAPFIAFMSLSKWFRQAA